MSLLEKKKDFTRQPSFDKRQYLVEFRLWGRVTKVKSDRSSGDLIEIETNPATAKCMIGQTHISRGLPIFCLTLSAATPNEFMMGYTTETRGKKYLSAILEVPWFRHSMRIYYWAQCNNFQNFVFSWDEISALSWFYGWHQEKGTIWDQARSMKWMHENNHLYWFLERLSHSQLSQSPITLPGGTRQIAIPRGTRIVPVDPAVFGCHRGMWRPRERCFEPSHHPSWQQTVS